MLVEAQQQGRLARKLAQLARFDVVHVDELGYVPLDKTGADLLFGFISQRHERRSLVVTTNLPFARWSEVFLAPTTASARVSAGHRGSPASDRNRRLAARVGGGRDRGFSAMGDPCPASLRRSRIEVLTGQPGGSLYPSG